MKTAIEQLHKEWNAGRFAPLYLFYGQDDYQIDLACAALVDKAVEPGSEDFNFDQLYGGESDGAA
ncbi:MAG TPA: hypothetical protein PKY55_17105, partial [bacterium]|nr:hypothetical protein [bacterium]